MAAVSRLVFEYALIRAAPRVERGECVNVGVLLYCQAADFLAVLAHVDDARLLALDPAADLLGIGQAVSALQLTCDGVGPASGSSLGQRFRWLTAPRSTVVHAGPVHSGFTVDPAGELVRLVDALVR